MHLPYKLRHLHFTDKLWQNTADRYNSMMLTYKLRQGRNNPVIRYKQVIAVAELPLGFKGLILTLQLGHPITFATPATFCCFTLSLAAL